jgi:site-specific DNA recombinase
VKSAAAVASPRAAKNAWKTASIRTRLDLMAEDEVLGLKTRAQVISATKRGNARIAEIDELLNASVTTDPLAG